MQKKTKKCGFIGNRFCAGHEKIILTEIKILMQEGINEFYSAHVGNFDYMCEQAVRKLGGKLIYVPYSSVQLKEADNKWYDELLQPYTDEDFYFDAAEPYMWLMEFCDTAFCYVYRNYGMEYKGLVYARWQGKRIINLANIKQIMMERKIADKQ